MTMRAQTEAMRAVAYVTSAAMDNAHRHPDAEARKRHQAFVDFMIPIVKGCSTETAQEIASLGIQVHGGMGYIEETGAAQHFRDARITTIYEGTTGIQANDFIGRKTARDGGAVARVVADEMDRVAQELARHGEPSLKAIGARLAEGVAAVRAAADGWSPPTARARARRTRSPCPTSRCGASSPAAGSSAAARSRPQKHLSAGIGDARFLVAKIQTARFYAEALLPQAAGLAQAVTASGDATVALPAEQF